MNTRLILWWLLFSPLAILGQTIFSGIDMLVIGLILTLQENRYKDLLWLLPLLVLFQEGVGSREFGAMVLWYFMVIVLFMIGRWLFEVQNLLFILLLFCSLGIAHFVLVYTMAPLQDLAININQLIDESLLQAVLLPPLWKLTSLTRRWTYAHADTA